MFREEAAWSNVHAQAVALLHRLAAARLRVQLVREALPPSDDDFAAVVIALDDEISHCASATKALVAEISVQIGAPTSIAAPRLVRETIAPLATYLERTEIHVVDELDALSDARCDRDRDRAAVAAVVGVLCRVGGSGGVLAFRRSSDDIDGLEMERSHPSGLAEADAISVRTQIEPIAAALSSQQRSLTVELREGRIVVRIELEVAR